MCFCLVLSLSLTTIWWTWDAFLHVAVSWPLTTSVFCLTYPWQWVDPNSKPADEGEATGSLLVLWYYNISTLFIIIKCPAELNLDGKILIRSVPSTGVTGWLSRGDIFYTWPKPTPSCMRAEANNNALSKLSCIAINTIKQICVIVCIHCLISVSRGDR